jgi:hypothetical protein
MKINGSLARMAIRALENDGHIKRIVHSRSQLIYSESPASRLARQAHSHRSEGNGGDRLGVRRASVEVVHLSVRTICSEWRSQCSSIRSPARPGLPARLARSES